MNCFMGYNPLVAKEVKITTWIKEFDGDSPVYPSFPNDGDCFVVFATDEDALTHNALSKKTYTNGDWADAEGGGGGGDFTTAEVTIISESAIDVYAYLPVAFDIPEADSPDAEGQMFIPFGETVVCNAIMFKGVCFLQLATTSIIIKSVDGDATKTSIDTAMIDGNCTITIGDAY